MPDLVPPFKDWEALDEQQVVDRLDAVVEASREQARPAAILAVIAVANYVAGHKPWPQAIERANELLADLEGSQSRRWG